MKTQDGRRGRFAFTLIELLVVIAIIGLLAGFLLPAIARAQWTARKAKCINNLSQFGKAVQIYRGDYDGDPPLWLSNLYTRYIPNEKLFLCPEDPTNGKDGGKPFWENDPKRTFVETDDFHESEADTIDPDAAAVQNDELLAYSYIYEFCCAECSWYGPSNSWNGNTADMVDVDVIPEDIHPNKGIGVVTWREIKEWELLNVGSWTPIIRCFWHTGGTFSATDVVLNVGAETHHIYHSDTSADGWNVPPS